ncbi:MAG: ComEC/Rec2 family competence protein [Clostridia bacterium]|nr:ComEC/Rec2 family competence protein [Clostridia bacterium]
MHVLANRPLAVACFSFAAAAVLAQSMPLSVQIICIIASVLSLAVLTFLYFKKNQRQVFLAILILFAVMLALLSSYLFFGVRYQNWQDRIGEECVVEGVVLEREVGKPYQSVLIAEIHSIDQKPCYADIRLQFTYASTLQVGDKFRLTGIGAPFDSKYSENEETDSLKDGILLCITSDDMLNCELIDEERFSLRATLSKWNFAAAYYLEQTVGGEAGKLASALLFGTRDHLSGDTALHFQRAGVSHLLALSGLHVSILIAALECLLRALSCPKRIRSIFVFAVAFGYLFFTGASPSIARAVLMLGVLTLGFYWNTDYDSFTAVGAVLALLLLISPNAVLDIGLWLSFVAATSIIIFLPAFESVQEYLYAKLTVSVKLIKAISAVITAIIVGIAANLALLYLQARFFGEVSLGSIPATLALSVPTTALLVLSVITLILPPVGILTALVGNGMLAVAEWFSNIDGILIPLGDTLSQLCALAVLLALVFVVVAKLKRVKSWLLLPVALSLLTVLTSVCVTYLPDRGVSFSVVQASGGEVILFTEKGKSVAVDFGDGTAGGGVEMLAIAKDLRCTELDDLILTHYHNRNTYFIALMAKRIRVKTLHLPTPMTDEERAIADRFISEGESHGIRVVFGAEELAIKNVEILALKHAEMSDSRHDALLFSAVAGGEVFTYFNGSTPDSTLATQMHDMINGADHVILGDTGFSNSKSTAISHAWHEHKTLFVTDQKLLRLLPNAAILCNIRYVDEPITVFVK